jgi:hypothetical protein
MLAMAVVKAFFDPFLLDTELQRILMKTITWLKAASWKEAILIRRLMSDAEWLEPFGIMGGAARHIGEQSGCTKEQSRRSLRP